MASPDVDVIATGLDNPRHVAVAPNGDVYVAEAGRGGDHATADSCFDSAEGFACTGDSGAVTRISKHGWRSDQERVLTGLASFAPADGSSAIGPHGIFVEGRQGLRHERRPDRADPATAQVVLRDPTLVAEDPVSALYGTLLKLAQARPLQPDRRPLGLREREQPGRGGRQPARRQQPGRRARRPSRPSLRGRRGRQHGPARLARRRRRSRRASSRTSRPRTRSAARTST